ncbi:MAG: hypothetical protein AAB953_00270, partial [Patescibacteria group bacterium]
MFKNKNQKIGTRIICGALMALLLLFHSSIVPAAYAEEAKPPAATCPAGWKEMEKDAYKCQIMEEKKCSEVFPGADYHTVNSETITEAEKDDTHPVKTTCAKTPKGTADTSSLLQNIAVLAGLQSFLNRLIWPVLVLIGGLIE